MKHIIVNITDQSVGCEGRPADTILEIRDFRQKSVDEERDRVQYLGGEFPYIERRFQQSILENVP